MKITYSNIDAEFRKSAEDEFARHVEKLERLLKHYDPDLVLVHNSLEQVPRRTEFNFSLNLSLPTGILHSTGTGADIRTSVKAAVAEIKVQLKKHQEKLRKDYVWKRKGGRSAPKLSALPTAD